MAILVQVWQFSYHKISCQIAFYRFPHPVQSKHSWTYEPHSVPCSVWPSYGGWLIPDIFLVQNPPSFFAKKSFIYIFSNNCFFWWDDLLLSNCRVQNLNNHIRWMSSIEFLRRLCQYRCINQIFLLRKSH